MTPDRSTSASERLHQRAMETFPSGVSHNVRYFEPYPIYIERAEGPFIWDADGNRYLDFWMNHMVSVLGHSYPAVVEAVREQVGRGLHYGAVNEKALELGEKVKEYVPSAERVRYCASGTEATMYAVRLARAYTDRNVVLKAEGGWHGGNTDLAKAIHSPFDEPETAGLPPGAAEHVDAFPVNDEAAVDDLLSKYEGEIAAIIVEPVMLAGGGVRLRDEFLEFLRAETAERGIQLIFDEVVTGFRVSPGSYQARVDVIPDLTTLGKFLGGGLPVGALCGRAELFEKAQPDAEETDHVLAGGGTFTINLMTATAGLASLEAVESEPVYEYTESAAERVRQELDAVYDDLGIDAQVLGESSMFQSHFQPEKPLTDIRAVETATNQEAVMEFHRRLHHHGYYFLPGHVGSVSYQTSEEQIDGFLRAAETVAAELVEEEIL